MADVQLDLNDVNAADLPDLCMKCAHPADTHVAKSFTWAPQTSDPAWAFFGSIGALIDFVIMLTKGWRIRRCTVYVPFCAKHRGHWARRRWVMYGTLPVSALLFAVSIAIILAAPIDPQAMTVSLYFMASSAILFILWAGLGVFLSLGTIRVVEITDQLITLRGVHPDWIIAYQKQVRKIDEDAAHVARERFGRGGP